jgi:hypothetical protein
MVFFAFFFGQDYSWDQLNYHFLSAKLLINGEYSQNVAPSGLQSWFNPIGYVPAYYLIDTLSPHMASFVLAAIAGLNAPLIYVIALRIIPDFANPVRSRVAMACVVIGMTGAITAAEAGTTVTDVWQSLFGLSAILCLLRALEGAPRRHVGLAGILIGMACGLKLTFIAWAAGSALTVGILVATRRLSLAAFMVFALGGIAGYLATGGWWAWRLWSAFGNPVFPLFNDLFHSPWAPAERLNDLNFLPQDWTDIITFPLHWLIGDSTPGAEISIRDPRYFVGLLASVTCLGAAFVRGDRQAQRLLLALLFLGTYLIWLFAFGILRYAVMLEMLSGVLLLASLRAFPRISEKTAMLVMWGAALLAIGTTHYASWARVPFSDNWYGIDGIAAVHQPHTVYVMPDAAPLGFLVAAFPKDARFARIGGNFPLSPETGWGVTAAAMIGRAPHLRTLSALPNSAAGVAALLRFGLVADPASCRKITIKTAPVESCALARAE